MVRSLVVSLVLMGALALVVTGCGGGGSSGSSGFVAAPTVILTANTEWVDAGTPVTLTWSSVGADRVESTFSASSLQGSATVTPSVDTTYTITVHGPGGASTASVKVIVYPKNDIRGTWYSTDGLKQRVIMPTKVVFAQKNGLGDWEEYDNLIAKPEGAYYFDFSTPGIFEYGFMVQWYGTWTTAPQAQYGISPDGELQCRGRYNNQYVNPIDGSHWPDWTLIGYHKR